MAELAPAYRYRAELVDIIDGDTLRLRVDLGFRCAVTIEGRVRGINTPELDTPEGRAAREWAVTALTGHALVIESYHDRRSFARWIVDVYVDGASYADQALAAGQAVVMNR